MKKKSLLSLACMFAITGCAQGPKLNLYDQIQVEAQKFQKKEGENFEQQAARKQKILNFYMLKYAELIEDKINFNAFEYDSNCSISLFFVHKDEYAIIDQIIIDTKDKNNHSGYWCSAMEKAAHKVEKFPIPNDQDLAKGLMKIRFGGEVVSH